ncbi:MAG: dUTP pyrophosphatase [Rhizobiaceae bacterium]|nr:dUTP pyrophosphatase [Rhizobiaceae bacterium]
MFLSGQWIAENGPSLISPFNLGQVDCSAYTMRVGHEAYVSPDAKHSSEPEIVQLEHKQGITIPPGQFAFLMTREFISIPSNLFALINIKSGLKVQGLVNVSGFHVDPGYQGNLIFAVFNAGPKTLIIRENDLAFLIWFARLEQPSEDYARKKGGYTAITSELASNIPRESASMNSLSRRIEDIERKLSYLMAAGAFLGAIAIAVLANWFSQGGQ